MNCHKKPMNISVGLQESQTALYLGPRSSVCSAKEQCYNFMKDLKGSPVNCLGFETLTIGMRNMY